MKIILFISLFLICEGQNKLIFSSIFRRNRIIMVEAVENTSEKEDSRKTVHDHPVFKTIADGDMETMRNYFEVEGVSLELEDGTGMTPLMHASWKGQQEVAKYLLKQGADANGGNHEHHYTSLHFAGLAGKPNICSLLLEAGAKTHHTNSVNRTAAGGQNYYQKESLDSFLLLQGWPLLLATTTAWP